MLYLEVKNASRPILLGTTQFTIEPIVLRGGMWMGVLKIPDELEVSEADILTHPRVKRKLSETEYNDLKKKRWDSLPSSEIVEPELPDAEPAEKKPESVEEVLLEGSAEVEDPLSDEPKKKRRSPRPKVKK